MKGLLIAAGKGSRIAEVTDSKPLTPVAGTPLIERVLSAAAEAGLRDFVMVTGHAAARVEALTAQVSAQLGLAVTFVRVEDWEGGNGHSVLAGAERIDGEYLLMMGDHLFDPDILARLLRAPAPAALLLAVDRHLDGAHVDLSDATRVEVASDGRIVRIGKELATFNAVDTGFFRVTPRLAEAIRADIAAGGAGSLSAGVQRLADAKLAATLDVSGAFWFDVDDVRALRRAEAMLAAALPGQIRDNAA